MSEHSEHKESKQRSKHQASAVPQEHLAGLAEHIVEEERNECPNCNKGKCKHRNIPTVIEDNRKCSAGHNTVRAAVAVYPVNKVDGIHYSNSRNQG